MPELIYLILTASVSYTHLDVYKRQASNRAIRVLESTGIFGTSELKCTKKVLGAAALTYVAAAASSILQLLRLILLFGGRDDD